MEILFRPVHKNRFEFETVSAVPLEAYDRVQAWMVANCAPEQEHRRWAVDFWWRSSVAHPNGINIYVGILDPDEALAFRMRWC